MAVDALELKPRSPLALFDSAVRLCAKSMGVWALTLPAGVAIVAATFRLAEDLHFHRPLLVSSVWFSAAWLFRALCQGAAAHYLELKVLEVDEPSVWRSFALALKHAPALFYAAALCLVLNGLVWSFSIGIGFLLVGAHFAAYAVAMKGRGSLLGLYGTCSRMLGPARSAASWLRVCGLAQAMVALNLHLGVTASLAILNKLLAVNTTFIARFAALDNPVWLAAVGALTFALFEPVRAACAALLLIDGRVRQEGLDLLTQLEQLPMRRKPRAAFSAALGATLVLLVPALASADSDDWSGSYVPGERQVEVSTAMGTRLWQIVSDCGLDDRFAKAHVQQIDRLPESAQGAASRFVVRIERLTYDDENCDGAAEELSRGLKQIEQAVQDAPDKAETARAQAERVLNRPEFEVEPPPAPKEKIEKPDDESEGPIAKWFREQWEAFVKWLFGPERHEHHSSLESDFSPNLGISNIVVVAAIALVGGVLLWLLLRGFSRDKMQELQGQEGVVIQTALAPDPMNALSRPPESWAGLADELAAKGLYRDAIRSLYLALLSRLHGEGFIDYDPALSNWDYFRGFKGPMEALTPFRELTRRFDFAWYGNLEVGGESWATFRALTQPLLDSSAKERLSA